MIMHALLSVVFLIAVATPMWMGTGPNAWNRATNVYMGAYLAVMFTVALLFGPTMLVTTGLLAPLFAWLHVSTLYTDTPPRRFAVLTGMACLALAVVAAGYAATALADNVGWAWASPALLAGYAGWGAYLLAQRPRPEKSPSGAS